MIKSNKLDTEQPETSAPKMKKRELSESNFELVILAAQRCKQLVNGAHPRVGVPAKNPRNTYVAIQEVELGLIGFKGNYDD